MGDRRTGLAIGLGLVVVAALVAWLVFAEDDGDRSVPLAGSTQRAVEQPAGFESAAQPEPTSLALADAAMTEAAPAADVAIAMSSSGTGGLVVQVTWASDGQPAADVGVSIVEFTALGSARVEHRGVTDATGATARDGLRPGKVGVYLDRADGELTDVRAGETTELAVAIPAVLAHNAFNRRNRVWVARLEEFAHELYARTAVPVAGAPGPAQARGE